MRIQEIQVKNFRSILDETLPCDSLTALVGRNGSGKSSFLSAIELFYDESARVTVEDFYSEDTTQDIEIATTYTDLSADAQKRFSSYIDNDELTVVRVFSLQKDRKSGVYHGMGLRNPDFAEVRNANGAREKRRLYDEIRQEAAYSTLPSVTSATNALQELDEWENQNPQKCVRMRDDGQFFGFTNVFRGRLSRHTKFIRVPAVRDAQEDAVEKRGSCVTEIMDLVVRSVLANRKELADFRERTQTEYKELIDPDNLTELQGLQMAMTATLQHYAPETGVLMNWSEAGDINIPLPQAEVKLLEDGYQSTVERTGHGLQRAFIVTMLQHLVAARSLETSSESESDAEDSTQGSNAAYLPSLVLAIEEPELYQHPSRQRFLASTLSKLAQGSISGVATSTQVVYTTHSPLFVGLDRFPQIRVLRKAPYEDGKANVTRLTKGDMDAVAGELWKASGSQGAKFSADTLFPRLRAIMTPWMNEGFFADTVVLVEGEDDRAAILGVAGQLDYDFDSLGIAVVPCSGKNNIDRPLLIFRQLGIPVYVVWDGDYGDQSAKTANRFLLRLLGRSEEDWPTFVDESSACFVVNLEKTLEDELGKELYECSRNKAQQEFGITEKAYALKNPAIFERVVEHAESKGKVSNSLQEIVKRIAALNGSL